MFLMVETGVKGEMMLFINMQKLITNMKDYGKIKNYRILSTGMGNVTKDACKWF